MNPPPTLQDWQFWGFIASAIGVIITLVIFYVQRQRKDFSYEVVSDNQLISVDSKLAKTGRLEILLDGKPVGKARLVVLRFTNRGNLPIRASDFDTELSLKFPNEVQLLDIEINASTDSLKQRIAPSLKLTEITFPAVLLNSKDWFTVKVIVTDYDDPIPVPTVRIEGIRDIKQVTTREDSVPPQIITILLLTLIIAFLNNVVIDEPFRTTINYLIGPLVIIGQFALIGMTFRRLFPSLLFNR